jgi:putative spermidine/putrescine transport system permease protein
MNYRPSTATAVAACLVAALLLLPSIIAIPASFTDRPYLSLPKDGLSFQHYVRFAENESWRGAFLLSLTTSFTAAVAATVLGTACAVGLWGHSSAVRNFIRAVVLLPLAVPGILAALSFYLLFTRIGLYDTVLGVIVVQIVVGLPFVVISASTGLAMLDDRQVRASRSMGAGPWRTLISVVLPNIKGSILSGFVLAFVSGWDEAVITLFVTGRNVQVLPRKIWDSLRYDIDPIVAVVATIMFVSTFIGVLAFTRAAARRQRLNNPS